MVDNSKVKLELPSFQLSSIIDVYKNNRFNSNRVFIATQTAEMLLFFACTFLSLVTRPLSRVSYFLFPFIDFNRPDYAGKKASSFLESDQVLPLNCCTRRIGYIGIQFYLNRDEALGIEQWITTFTFFLFSSVINLHLRAWIIIFVRNSRECIAHLLTSEGF